MFGLVRTGGLVILAALTSGCSLPDTDAIRMPEFNAFRPRSVAALRDDRVRAVTPADFVDAQGGCAAPADAAPDAPAPVTGVALQMTECEVVQRAGRPERIDIGQNEGSERTATLTYVRGNWPGVYGFVGGRLKTVDQLPQAAPPQRPARPARRAQG